MFPLRIVTIIFLSLFFIPAFGGNPKVFVSEKFMDLSLWKHTKSRGTEKMSIYSIETNLEDTNTYLRAESDASASLLVYQKTFSVYDYPLLRWRWRADNLYKFSDGTKKNGDDFVLRFFVIFKYNPEKSPVLLKLGYDAAKLFYGVYPPDSGLVYVWESRKQATNVIVNPYYDQSRQVILESGPEKLKTWVEESVNVLEDYRKIFGRDPPDTASLAIMNDSDNTGEKSVSYMDDIEVYKDGD